MASAGGREGGGGSRAFAQKLTKHHAQEIRRHAAAELKGGDPGGASAQRLLAAQIGRSSVQFPSLPASVAAAIGKVPTASPSASLHSSSHTYGGGSGGGDSTVAVEPLDYEEYVSQQHRLGERDPLAHVLEFPGDDIEVKIVPKKIRTLGHVMPEEAIDHVDASVQNCVDCYTSDYVVVRRKHQHLSSSVRASRDDSEERLRIVDTVPAQEFEVDDTPDVSPEYEHLLRADDSVTKVRKWRQSMLSRDQLSMPNSLGGSRNVSLLSLDSLGGLGLARSTSLTSVIRWRGNDTSDDTETVCDVTDGDYYQTVDDLDEGECTPTNDKSPLFDTSKKAEIDAKRLSDILEAMSTPQVFRTSARRSVERTPAAATAATGAPVAQSSETPRGSWATFDLRNSLPDAPIPGLLDHVDAVAIDQTNEARRASEQRLDQIFSLYPAQADAELVERRLLAEEPTECLKHRILVQCNKLDLSLPQPIEPIFASMALYDAKERKKISENFYFDLNTEQIRRMLEGYIPQADYSTQARSCVFEISQPTPDLFLVVKLEKVLQGDISEAAEPYLKEANLDKVRASAYDACNRLGKYRMPFAWTAIWLQNIIKGKQQQETNNDSGSDAESTASNSLDRKSSTSSFEQFRKGATKVTGDSSSLTRRTSLERSGQQQRDKRSSWAGSLAGPGAAAEELTSQLDSFPPVTLTVSSFFKQEGDKLKDDDLYKFLIDLKRPSTALKRLKCIRGTLKLDISVAPEQSKNCFTPELAKLIPFPDMKSRPTKEILEFPPREILLPNYQFRNLLYICPKDLNFTNRSGERARNIAVKVQFMGEDDSQGMKVIFGKSSCPEFTTEAYTAVTYHNKTPDFYEEVKVKLPSNLRERHHLLFTFYHISCQGQRKEQISTEVPVGYTWIPIFRAGSLQSGLFELPVMLDPPPAALRYIPTDSAPPGTKWVDNKKTIFSVELQATTTVHPLDKYLDAFLNLTATLQLGQAHLTHANERSTEDDLLKRLAELSKARLEPLVKYLPLVLDKLLLLMVRPPSIAGHVLNVAQAAFNAIAEVVNKISKATDLAHQNDRHGRNCLLTSYIHYQAHLPHPDFRNVGQVSGGRPASAPSKSDRPGISLLADEEVGNIIMKGNVDRDGTAFAASPAGASAVAKLVHEQLAVQWSISGGASREMALTSGWFFLELMVKAMVEHLATTSRLGAHRKSRFSEQFHDDVINLVASLTSDIVCRHKNSPEVMERLNTSLGFFLHDLLSVMDRGFVFSLIRSYMKDVNSRMTSKPESLHLWHLQLDFARIVCSHEHFVPLNLPSVNPSSEPLLGGASSPSPSIRSNDSQSSFIAHSVGGQDRTHWAELTQEFRRRHFMVGLVLSLLSKSLEQLNSDVHTRAVNLVRNLISFHDSDPRYRERDCRARVANLYLPLVGIVIDNLQRLYSWSTEGQVRIVGSSNPNEHLNMILTAISDNVPNAKGPIILKDDTTRHLLVCVLWVIKNVEKSVLKLWWSELSSTRLQTLLEILRICISCFQYKRRKTGEGILQFKSEPNLWFGGGGGIKFSLGLPRSPSDTFQRDHMGSPPPEAFDYAPRSLSPHTIQGCSRYPEMTAEPVGPKTARSTESLEQKSDLSYLALESIFHSHSRPKGKRLIRKHATLGARKSSDMRSRLEDMIMGHQSTSRQDMLSRSRKDRMTPLSPNPDASVGVAGGRRWNKSSSFLRSALTSNNDPTSASVHEVPQRFIDPETDAHLEGLLATETSMIVLDALEIVVQVVSQADQSSGLLASVLRVLLHSLGTNQSTFFLRHLFAVQRSFVFKFPSLLFDDASEHCADLCLRLLKHCSASIADVRSQASASLYLLMRQNFEIGNNFARVKMQVTMSLSKLVGTISNFNEEYLRRSLKTILVYAEQDQELSDTTFPEQVQDLVFNLHMILSDTVKMKEYIDDPEMHMDLMYRIAKGYQNSPDLRLTWLESMATKHEQYGHFAEAGMCKIHCAALISEYLHMLEDRKYMPTGAVTFAKLTPNSLEESAVSDDVVSPDEEGICTGKNFTEAGLMSFLDDAAKCFTQAGAYETVNEVYRAAIPIAEAGRNFQKLADIHKDLHEAFKNVNRLQGKRIFGTYFRVGFYGARFGDLDGEEYVYKEKALAKLPEIAHKLEHFYGEKFGTENLIIIKDSKNVEVSKLSSDKAYIQITYVEPFFDNFELRDRVTAFEKNFNIIRFIFATPFTPDGTPHGELHEQYKRKTILTTSHHFPYVKTRIQVVDRKQIDLTPIEVAIEDVQKKIYELEAATNQDPPDPKILQMVLQGCIGTTVNQGPMEVANVFLKDLLDPNNCKTPTKYQNKLRLCFKDFDKKCTDALKRNKKLISSDQKEYQKELEKNYVIFHTHITPLFNSGQGNHCGIAAMEPEDQTEPKVTSPMV